MTKEIVAIREDAVSKGYISELDSLGDAKITFSSNLGSNLDENMVSKSKLDDPV